MRSVTEQGRGRIAGYVLVGGNSSRFGEDKALTKIDGQPMAARTAEMVARAAASVTLIGSPQKYGRFGFRVIPDTIPGCGPLAGILTALEDTSAKWSLIVACDMPSLTAGFLEYLLEQTDDSSSQVILPRNADGLDEPLCAVYGDSAREAIRESLSQRSFKIAAALENLKVCRLDASAYGGSGKGVFSNLNSRTDLKDWLAHQGEPAD